MATTLNDKPEFFKSILKADRAGKLSDDKFYYYSQIDSTNDEAQRLGMAGAPEGTIVLADSQTKGRGRMTRVWHSPPASNIYISLLLRPSLPPAAAPQISLVAGVAVAELLEGYCPGRVELKWPNDVLIEGKKICGILAQMKTNGQSIDFVVVGIGINVNIRQSQFPGEIRETATSLSAETGREIVRSDLVISLYENFTKWYKAFLQSGFTAVKERWISLTPMIGKDIQIMLSDERIMGKALDLAGDGSLIILTSDNERRKISAGDATILKKE